MLQVQMLSGAQELFPRSEALEDLMGMGERGWQWRGRFLPFSFPCADEFWVQDFTVFWNFENYNMLFSEEKVKLGCATELVKVFVQRCWDSIATFLLHYRLEERLNYPQPSPSSHNIILSMISPERLQIRIQEELVFEELFFILCTSQFISPKHPTIMQ